MFSRSGNKIYPNCDLNKAVVSDEIWRQRFDSDRSPTRTHTKTVNYYPNKTHTYETTFYPKTNEEYDYRKLSAKRKGDLVEHGRRRMEEDLFRKKMEEVRKKMEEDLFRKKVSESAEELHNKLLGRDTWYGNVRSEAFKEKMGEVFDKISSNPNLEDQKMARTWLHRALRNKDNVMNMTSEERGKAVEEKIKRFGFLEKLGISKEKANEASDGLWEKMGSNSVGRWLRKKLELSIGQDEDLYKSLETISYLIENIEK